MEKLEPSRPGPTAGVQETGALVSGRDCVAERLTVEPQAALSGVWGLGEEAASQPMSCLGGQLSSRGQ